MDMEQMQKDAKRIYQTIDQLVGKTEKLTADVRDTTSQGDYSIAAHIAAIVDAKFPPRMETKRNKEGKDVQIDANSPNRKVRMDKLRTALARVSEERGEKVGIKKKDGNYIITVTPLEKGEEKPDNDGEAGAGEGEGGTADEGASEAAQEKLWQAVELVLANMGNPAVLSAIRTGLDNLTKGVKN